LFKVLNAVGSIVRQVPILGMAPDRLHRVKIRRIGWQELGDNPPPSFNPVLDQLRAVRLSAVPNERESLRQMSQQSLKEVKNFSAPDIVSVLSPVQTISSTVRGNRDCADGRESIAAIPLAKDRRLAPGCPGSSDHRLEHEAAFIEKDHASAGSAGVFLYGASARSATSQWPPRRALGRVALVSDNSILPLAILSTHGRGDSELQRYAQ